MNPFDQFDEKPDAKAKANPFDKFDGPELTPAGVELKDRAKAGAGGVEAAMSMASGLPGMIAGGLHGLGSYVTPGSGAFGDIDEAVKRQQAMQSVIPHYEPQTEYGKLANEGIGEIGGIAKEAVGGAGEKVGGPMGRYVAESLGGMAAALAPIPGGKFVGALGRGIKREFGRGPEPVAPAAPTPEAPKAGPKANPFDQFDLDLQHTPQQYAESVTRDKMPGQRDLFSAEGVDTIPKGNAPPELPPIPNRYHTAAQAAVDARQAAMEAEVARQQGLDFNAAERARQEAAPVPGMEDARAREAQQAAQRTQPYMDERNQGLIDDTDQGYYANQYGGGQGLGRVDENGIPIRADRSMEAQNLTDPLQRNLWGDELPRQSAQEAPYGITRAIDRMSPEARAAAIPDQFNNLSRRHAATALEEAITKANGPKGQRGAINLEEIGKGLQYLKDGFMSPKDYVNTFTGAFSKREMEFMDEAIRDPKSRTAVVLMSPDEFHAMAEPRGDDYMRSKATAYGPEGKRVSIREALKRDGGLDDVPWLRMSTKDGVSIVHGHEGRHRMDVFKELGIEKVPVRITDDKIRWGEASSHPHTMVGEGKTTVKNGYIKRAAFEDRPMIDMPEVLNHRYTEEGIRIPASQRGAINFKAFLDAVTKDPLAPVPGDQFKLRLPWVPGEYTVDAHFTGNKIAVDKHGREVPVGTKGATVELEVQYMVDGNVITNTFTPKDLALNTQSIVPKGQRGAIDLGPGKIPERNPAVANMTKDDPRVVAAGKQLEGQAKKSVAFKVLDMPYVDSITTPEQVIASASKAKDIGKGAAIRAKSVGAGMNSAALSSNNPFLKYVRYATREAEKWADTQSVKYITGDDGLVPKWQKLNAAERNEVMKHLIEQDKKETILSTDHLSDKQRAVVDQIAEMEKVKLKFWNEKLAEAGMKPVEERVGHFPGMFTGDYRTMVFDAKGNPQGFVGTGTKWGNAKVVAKLQKQFPDYKFVPLARKNLAGMGEGAYSTGMSELAKVLAEHDPKFKELMEQVNTLVGHNADNLYAAGLHKLGKKGIWGSEGNKDWKSATENTNEAMQAYKKYWDEGMRSHSTLPVEVAIKGLRENPALAHMPNAKDYVEKYMLNMTGRSTSTLAHAFDSVLDAAPRLAGIGPSYVRDAAGIMNKRVGQVLMGFGNIPHTIVQLLQAPSMGFPQVLNIAKLLGMGDLEASAAIQQGIRDQGSFIKERFTGQRTPNTPYMEAAFEYARKNGMHHFSEFQDIAESNQSAVGRGFDKVVDFNRSEAEKATRPLVYLSLVRLLEHAEGLTTEQKLSAAINATNEAMIDYSPREKPMMYRDVGQIGKLAGSLTTFKHGAGAQYGRLLKQAANGNAKPLVVMTAIMYAMAGVRGIFGYDDADAVVKEITSLTGERQSIRELLLDPNIQSEYLKAGALSASTGLDLAGRLNVGGFIPDSPLQAVLGASGSKVEKIGETAWQAGKNLVGKGNGPIDFKNLALELAPGGLIKNHLREGLMNDEETNILADKNAEPGNRRTPDDVKANKLGFTSLRQGLLNEAQYNDSQRQMAKTKAQKSILDQAAHYKAQGLLVDDKALELRTAYYKAGGTPQGWVDNVVKEAMDMGKTKQQRLQGMPDESLESLHRYKEFERSRKYNNAN